MKRFYSFALIMLTLISSVFFFACGDKYKDLSMSFYSSDGQTIEKLELVIDSSDASKAKSKIGVKFSGIDSEDIGSVIIYSSSNEAITVSNYVYSDDFVWVQIVANAPTSSSKIFVRHLDSNKLASIDLVINQKSNNIKIENSNYVVSIPASGENEHIIKTEEVLKLLPVGSTDKVFYLMDNSKSSYSDVDLITETIEDKEYIIGFKTNPESDGDATIFPVTVMEGYDVNIYENFSIKIHFIKVLSKDDVELKFETKYINPVNGSIYDPIELIYNDTMTNSATVSLEYLNDVDASKYSVSLSSSNKTSISMFDIGDNKIVIQAKTETEDVEAAYITWDPNGYVGDIKSITKQINVKGEAKADYISVKKAGVEISDLTETIDIYDYYQVGNALGAKFNFEPKTYVNIPVYKDLQKMQIVVDPKILNIKKDTNEGYNPIYEDKTFTTIKIFDNAWRTNKHVLDISLFGEPIKFYFDNDKRVMISEPFTKASDLYIKYQRIDGIGEETLKIDVETIYTGEAGYLAATTNKKATLIFSEKYGVESIKLDAGHFKESSAESYNNRDVKNVYLNVLDNAIGSGSDKYYKYYLHFYEILGVNGRITDSVQFDISVTSVNLQNSLKLIQGKRKLEESQTATTYLKYNYTSIIEYGAISLVFNKNTTVGEYEITISQPETGFSYSLTCWVYQDITNNDFYGVLETNTYTFNNIKEYRPTNYIYNAATWDDKRETLFYYDDKIDSYITASDTNYNSEKTYFERVYEFHDYTADYIMAANQNLNFEIKFLNESQTNSHIIKGYSITTSIDESGEDVKDYLEDYQYNDTNIFTFNSIKGTYITPYNRYIYVSLNVTVQQYDNILTAAGVTTLTKAIPIKIFIYEPITYDNLSITAPMQRYFGDYLGANYSDYSQTILEVGLDDTTLWNYIQKSSQSDILDLSANNYRVVWLVDNEDNIEAIQQTDKTLNVKFLAGKNVGYGLTSRTFTAIVYQFNNRFMLTCRVDINRSVIAEKVEIKEVKVNDNLTNLKIDTLQKNYYINLKLNDELILKADSSSNYGDVTHKGFFMVAVDSNGNVDNTNVTVENENQLKLKVNNVVAGLKLIIIAKDALKYNLEGITSGFDNIEELLVDLKNNNNEFLHKNAYIVINLELSDGKNKRTPYLIESADDFWKMANEHSQMTYDPAIPGAPFYRLAKNIDLTNTILEPKAVAEFNGTISTTYYTYESGSETELNPFYTISGVKLENDFTNLFTNLNGVIENIKFSITYMYNFTSENELTDNVNMGVIDKNNGTLTNVSCEISGTSIIDDDSSMYKAYFGGLVGVNFGTIQFVDGEKQCIGVSGITTIEGNAEVYFGGLVGKNVGTIKGYEIDDGVITGIEFTIALSDAGLMSTLNITSELINSKSAVGGVVGLNTYDTTLNLQGTLINAEVGGSITSSVTSNIGGVIGKNILEEALTISIERWYDVVVSGIVSNTDDLLTSAHINNIKSYAIVSGKNNIGGVVGFDSNGVYANIKYQIVANADTPISGEQNVGGIAGSSTNGKFIFCSVMSYKWDYNAIPIDTITLTRPVGIAGWEADDAKPDISASNFVGGIVGKAVSSSTESLGIGTIDVTDRVIVYNSSVNAYMESEDQIGGLLSSEVVNDNDIGIVFNVYFIGRLSGNVGYVEDLCLFNEGSAYKYGQIYSVNYESSSDEYKITEIKDGYESFELNANPSLDYWFYNSALNGGYIYVINNNDKPIFEVAPTSILVEVQERLDSDKNGNYNNEVNPYFVNSSTIWLPYYKFTGDASGVLTVEVLAELDLKYNKVTDLTSFLKFTVEPTGGARLKVESSDKSVIIVGANGDLFVKGIGSAVLTFSSRLNNGVKYSINVIVTYPVGDSYKIIDVESKLAISGNVNISKGSSKLYTIETEGMVPEGYYYETNSNVDLDITVTYPSLGLDSYRYKKYVYNESTWAVIDKSSFFVESAGSYANVAVADVNENDAIEGKYYIVKYNGILNLSNVESEQEINTNVIDKYLIPYNIPFSISVLQKVETDFNFEVIPYLTLVDVNGNYHEKENIFGSSTDFTLITSSGPSGISLSYNSAILYPNDTTIITAYIKTDKELTLTEINNYILQSSIIIKDTNGEDVANNSLIEIKFFEDYGFDPVAGIHMVQFEIAISEDVCKLAKKEEKRFTNIEIVITEKVKASVDYTILPQRINAIEIKNYYRDYVEFTSYNSATWDTDKLNLYYIENNEYKSAKNEIYNSAKTYYSSDYVLDTVLQQDRPGLLIIDMAPVNGYFDYLEIIDASESEHILFTQIDSKDGNTLFEIDKPANYGKGIRLVKNYAKYNNRIYVTTNIDESYASTVHTLIVYAFLEDGTCLNPSGTQYDINVEMLPQIKADYRVPSGKVGYTASTFRGYNANINLDLAIGTYATFFIETKESDGLINHSLTGDAATLYKFEHDNGNFYKLIYIGDGNNHSSYLGKNLKLELKTQSNLSNGTIAEAIVSFNITLVEFVVHDVSVSNSVDSNNITQIYGNINQELDLEFYFKSTDISYYNDGKYWNKLYMYDNSIDTVTAAGASATVENYINDILRELNTRPETYISLKYELKEEFLTDYRRIADKPVANRTNSEKAFIDSIKENKDLLTNDAAEEIEKGKISSVVTSVVKLSGKNLKVTNENYNKYYNIYLDVNLNLVKNNNKFTIAAPTTNPTISKSYLLNFVKATSPYEPKLIKNEKEFLSMTTGYYILGVDLVLEEYSSLIIVEPTEENPAQLVEFDGNGRTITIKSFKTEEFTDESMQVGLFKYIPKGTTIKNLNVKYLSVPDASGNYPMGQVKTNVKTDDFKIESYFDLCENKTVNYSSATFGGIAASNYGIITNCNVMGEIAISASTVEEKKYVSETSANSYEINFFIGGLVGTNETTGYITNSTSALRIFSQANIGGLVYSNKGKIASSAVDSVIDYSDDVSGKEYQPLMYNYNNSLERTIVVKMGGFVVENYANISMSYTNFNSTELLNANKIGNMSAKDISAGFVYSNSGSISDAYVSLEITGNSQNDFYGFVYQNSSSAKIEYAYTYVNEGKWGNTSHMFASNSTEGLYNCLEIVNYDDSYTVNSSKGLFTEKLESRNNKDIYEQCNFAFGDNKTAVWQIISGQMPKLVSTLEKVVYTENKDKTTVSFGDNSTYTYYYGLKDITLIEEYKENEKGEYVKTITETTDHSSYGTKNNPIIILDRIESNKISNWDNYFTQENSKKFFRIVSDINLSAANKNPTTSTLTFSGNIQGNNMELNDFMLYSTDSLDSIGLFKEIVSTNDIAIDCSIRNLRLSTTSVWTAKTKAVGLLAGIIENYNLYNIHVDSPAVVMVGGNAVGGVAGVIRGNFDVQRLSSNIGVNSTRVSSGYKYSIYMSKNNGMQASANLNNSYYAGSVVGILDAYNNDEFKIADPRNISTGIYFNVKDIVVSDNVVVLADTAGAAFGLVGERVKVQNINVNLTEAKLSGSQYSAGAIGENRGVVNNVNVVIKNEAFEKSSYVIAGVVGLNFGGLVQNAKASFKCENTFNNVTVGGIVGRNIYGTITDSISDACIVGYYTGGVVGSNYKYQTLEEVTSSAGALTDDCKINSKLTPTSQVVYKVLNENVVTPIHNFTNTGITSNSLNYMLQNINKFYTVSNKEEAFQDAVAYNRVLGLCVGVTDDPSYIVSNYGVVGEEEDLTIMFNYSNSYNETPTVGVVNVKIGEKEVGGSKQDIMQEWPCANVLELNNLKLKDKDGNLLTGSYMTYITGAVISVFDAWSRDSYAADMLVISDQTPVEPIWKFRDGVTYYISIEKINESYEDATAPALPIQTIEYIYVIRNLSDTSADMAFDDFSTLLESFEEGKDYFIKVNYIDVDPVVTPIEISCSSNEYNLELKGTALVSGGSSEYTLIYKYKFKVV